ncbi:MAG: hypothetical protein ABIK09_19785 [Pseudomonadota bacterium]
MDSPYLVISRFITILEKAAEDLAPGGLRWKVVDRHLQVTPLPEGLIPNYLVLARAQAGGDWLASDDALGVLHVTDEGQAGEELVPAAREIVQRLSALLLEAATDDLAGALDIYEDRNTPLGGLTRVDLVARGFRRAGSVLVEKGAGAREAVAARVPFVVDPRPDHDATPRQPVNGMSEKSLLYCAGNLADGERLRDLDAIFSSGAALTAEDLEVFGLLLGVPRCCIDAFDPALFQVPARRAHAARLDAFLAAAVRGGATPFTVFSPLLNFLSASLYQLVFLEHLPCGPGCHATREQNQRALETLYDATDVAVVREMLSLSYICWPDGRLVPFRCLGVEGDTIRVADLGRFRWPDHMPEESRELLRTGVPGATDGGAVDALRWTGSRWEARVDDAWVRLRERGRWFRSTHPKVALFDAGAEGR